MKNLNTVLSVIVLSFSAVACGNIQSSGLNSNSYQSIATNNGITAQEQCATSPNVTGQGYNNVLQTQYRVCSTSSATNTITIYAEDQVARSVYVYPVRANGTQITIYPAYASNVTTRASGVSVSFGSALAANAVYIVDASAVARFNVCIQISAAGNGSMSACASQQNIGLNYGYGSF